MRGSRGALDAVERGERTAHELVPKPFGEVAAHREQSRRGIRGAQRSGGPVEPCRPESHGCEAGRSERSGQTLPPRCDRRRPVLAVAAEQLVGALAGERDGDLRGSELARARGSRATRGRRAARRGARRAPRGRPSRSANESSSSWWSVPKCSATKRASASSFVSPASANPTEKVLTGSVICRAISATIRLESRPPLSIAPSGTSLISRRRTDSSRPASRRSRALARGSSRPASGSG